VPGPLLRGAAGAARLLGADGWRIGLEGPHLRYGFTLDTSRARQELGFRPGYRVGPGLTDDGRPRVETTQI
jgi:nucleoside-diphosphate-sugar epimerase